MLGSQTHSDFQKFVASEIKKYLSVGNVATVLVFHRELASVWNTDLSLVHSIVKHCYTTDKGRPARSPVSLMRSLLLMELRHSYSLDRWVADLKSQPILAILSGFLPNDIPGVGTFYDFQKRLWSAANAHLSKKLRRSYRKPKKGKKKGDKSPYKPGVIKRLVNRYLKNPPTFSKRPHNLLQQILKDCFVLPSANKGILGDTSSLAIAGDGTSVRTGAGRYGKLVCDCSKNGIYRCHCTKIFTDPDANWGWDSYREQFFFGRSLYAFTAAESPYDLPVYLNLTKASRNDGINFIYSFFEMMNLYPDFNVAQCLLDSAHDAYSIYKLLHQYDVAALVDLNSYGEGRIKYEGDFTFTENGVPICPKGHTMSHNWYDKQRFRHKWRCPLISVRKKIVYCESPCSPSPYGRTFYTKATDNLRFFTRIPRGTDMWKKLYKKRTAVERTFKRLKEDYLLERRGKIRSSRAWHFRTFTSAMCLHIDAWIKHEKIGLRSLVYQWQQEVLNTSVA